MVLSWKVVATSLRYNSEAHEAMPHLFPHCHTRIPMIDSWLQIWREKWHSHLSVETYNIRSMTSALRTNITAHVGFGSHDIDTTTHTDVLNGSISRRNDGRYRQAESVQHPVSVAKHFPRSTLAGEPQTRACASTTKLLMRMI